MTESTVTLEETIGMSFEEIEDVKAQVREELPDAEWPDVSLEPLYAGIPGGDDDFDEIVGYNAICIDTHDKDGNPLRVYPNVCTDQYLLVPHEVVYHKLNQAVKEIKGFGNPLMNLMFYDDGAKFEMTISFPEVGTKIARDKVVPQIVAKNSNDLHWQASISGWIEVLRCSNGMYAGHEAFSWRKKHRLNYSVSEQAAAMIAGMENMNRQYDIWRQWAKKQLTAAQTEQLFEALPISEKQAEKILELPEIGTGTRIKDLFDQGKKVDAWTINSLITQWITHDVSRSSGRRDREEKVGVVMDRFIRNV